MTYTPVKTAVQSNLPVNNINYRLNCWGDESAIPVLLLHGWADTGMTFQFLADCLSEKWYLVAPDWRGFGGSGYADNGYWFPDYLADLDVLIEHLSPSRPIRLVGHSMGGNVAWVYAGIRPERVSHAVSLDVFGLPDMPAEEAPSRYRKWLEQRRTEVRFSEYPDRETVIDKLLQLAPGLSRDKAAFLADYWSMQTASGTYTLNADPAHRRMNPVLYRREEARSCWRAITARAMLIMATDSFLYGRYINEGYRQDVMECFSDLVEEIVSDAGHMLHQEIPEKVAGLLEPFLLSE